MHLIKRVWKGKCKLSIAWGVFVGCVVFFFVVGLVMAVIEGADKLSAEPSITPGAADIKGQLIIYGIVGLCGAIVYAWSLMGVWRSSQRAEKTARIVSKVAVVLLGIYFVVFPVFGLVMAAVSINAVNTLQETGGSLKQALDKTEKSLKDPSASGAVQPESDSPEEIDQRVKRTNQCNEKFDETYRGYGKDPSMYPQEREKYLQACVQ